MPVRSMAGSSVHQDGGVPTATSLEGGVPESFTSAATGVLMVPSRWRTGIEFYIQEEPAVGPRDGVGRTPGSAVPRYAIDSVMSSMNL